jgi:hypothetical protein
MSTLLVRWLDEATADALRDEGMPGRLLDFLTIGYTFVTDSVERAKKQIENDIINHKLINSFNDDGVFVSPPPDQFYWRELDGGLGYYWKGNLVAFAMIYPTEILIGV